MTAMASDNKFVSSWNEQLPKSDYETFIYQIQQELKKMETCLPVKVLAVSGGGLAPVGYVDVQPLVQQLTVANQPVSQGTITNLPYFRLQGGSNAVIIDPEVGDIGLACFASRDVSGVKNVKGESPPSSRRQYSLNDGFYIGGFLNKTPVQYIQFGQDGIKIYSPTKLTLEAPQILIDSPIIQVTGNFAQTGTKGQHSTFSGNIVTTGGDVVADDISLQNHVHKGVTPGSGNTGEPV